MTLLEDKIAHWVIKPRTTVSVRFKAAAAALTRDMKINDFQEGPSWCFRFMKRRYLSNETHSDDDERDPGIQTLKIKNLMDFGKRNKLKK